QPPHYVPYGGADVHVVALEQGPLPQRVVQVPNQALDRDDAIRLRRRFRQGSADHADQTSQRVAAHAATGLLLSTSTRSPSASSPPARSRSRFSTTSIAPRWPYSPRCARHIGWMGK